MIRIDKNDYLILKNSSSWASRSISKLRLLFDKLFGDELKSILNKSIGMHKQLKDVLDGFVTGSISTSTTEDSKTVNDHKAISSFVVCGNNFNNISNQITTIIIPNLRKVGIDITPDDFKQNDKAENIDKNLLLTNLQNMFEDLHNVAISGDDDGDDIIKDRNDLMNYIEDSIKAIKMISSEYEAKEIHDNIFKVYNSFLSKYKDKISMLASGIYKDIIKKAESAEEAISYYLMSTAGYTKVLTPLKEKIFAIKSFLGYAGDETINSLRVDCIKYSKELIIKSEWLVDEIEKSIKLKEDKEKWIRIINALNEFGALYNKYRKPYIELFSVIKIKANQDKLFKQTKKNKGKLPETVLKDFVNHSWVDLPSKADSRFPLAILISV